MRALWQVAADAQARRPDLKNVVVPESDYAPTTPGEKRIPPFVGQAAVLAAINLNGDPTLNGSKIRNEGTDRHLPAKFDSCEPPIARQPPDDSFDISAVAAEIARNIPLLSFTNPSPSPGSRLRRSPPSPASGRGEEREPYPSAASSSSSASPAMIFSAISPAFARTALSILAAMSGLFFRKVLAFSRPCPMRWLS